MINRKDMDGPKIPNHVGYMDEIQFRISIKCV